MEKTAESCSASDPQPRYRLSLSGKKIKVDTGEVDRTVSLRGLAEMRDGALSLTSDDPGATTGGTVEVHDDCFVNLDLTLPVTGGGTVEMRFRGVLVNGGKELLGMAIDPGTAITPRWTTP